MKVKLGEVFENVINGDWGDEPTGNNDVAIIRTTNFTNDGIINYNNVVYRQIKKDIVLKKKLIYGDIIIEKSGGSDNFPVGRVVYYDKIDEIYLCNNFTSILRTNKELVVSKYLLYLMLNLYKKGITTKFQTKTTGIRNLQLTSYLANTEITIHDIQIQKEIVSILDKVTSLISMRKEQLEKLDILVKSKFIEMFGDPVLNPKCWEKKKGNKLFNFTNGRFLSSSHRTQSGVPVFGGNGIAWHTNEPFIFFPTIIIGRVGENCGNIHYSTESIWVTDNAIYISKFLHKIFNLIYLSYEMNLLNFRSKAEGGGQPKITQKILNDCYYRIPPLDLQNQFAEFVEQVEKNKENIKSSLNQLETLYSALMQEYFG